MAVAVTAHYPRRRVLLALFISLLPINCLRIAGYRRLGYGIPSDSKIGLFTVIACQSFNAGKGLVIGRNNRFIGPMRVILGDRVLIGRFNSFLCGASAADPAKAAMGYARCLRVGSDALINDAHYFDVYGEISIGAGTWIAGIESQFWTHGASTMDRDISVGEGCYIGSAVRMAPGTSVGNRCVVGIASVIVSELTGDDTVFGGFPARKIRDISPDDKRQFVFEKS